MRPPTLSSVLRGPALRHSFRSQHLAPARFVSSNASEAAQKKAQDAMGNLGKTAENVWQRTKMVLGTVGNGLASMLGSAFTVVLLKGFVVD
jgi:hypothetical protein